MSADEKAGERAERLKLIRQRLHKIRSQRESERLGVEPTRYSNWAKRIKDFLRKLRSES
jgi:hypothetical protein